MSQEVKFVVVDEHYVFSELCVLKDRCSFVDGLFNERKIIPALSFGFQVLSQLLVKFSKFCGT
jgi:hypothetical protein